MLESELVYTYTSVRDAVKDTIDAGVKVCQDDGANVDLSWVHVLDIGEDDDGVRRPTAQEHDEDDEDGHQQATISFGNPLDVGLVALSILRAPLLQLNDV